jgi:hypothetical protein
VYRRKVSASTRLYSAECVEVEFCEVQKTVREVVMSYGRLAKLATAKPPNSTSAKYAATTVNHSHSLSLSRATAELLSKSLFGKGEG